MKCDLCLALASVLVVACHNQPPPPASMRLRVEPGKVLWGQQSLPTHPDDLAEHLRDLIASGKIAPVVRMDFAKEVTGDHMGQIFYAVICGEGFVNMTLYFSVGGHHGRDFRLTLPTECCDPVPFETCCDEWGEGMLGESQGRRYLEFDVALREGEFTAGDEPLEPDEIAPMLMSRRRLAEEITVHITIGSEDTAGGLLPLLESCQNLEMDVNIGAEQREADERQHRMLACLMKNFAWRRPFLFPPVSPGTVLPDVPARSNLTSPSLLPERWLMSCPMGSRGGFGRG
jgi:hypothetical protein